MSAWFAEVQQKFIADFIEKDRWTYIIGVSTENYLQPEKGGEKMRKAGMYVLGASLGVILAKIVSALIRALLA